MRRNAFSLLELLVVVTILCLLAALLFPVFAQARRKALQTACTSNLRQIGVALGLYQADANGLLPVGTIRRWQNTGPGGVLLPPGATREVMEPLNKYLGGKVLECPVQGHGYMIRWVKRIGTPRTSRLMLPDPSNVLVYCLHHLDKGWSGNRYSETILGVEERKGRYVALRADLSVGLPNATELRQQIPYDKDGEEVWRPQNGAEEFEQSHPVFA